MSEAAGVLVTILWALREGRDPTPEVGLSVIEYLSMTQFWISDAKLDHRNRRFQLICPSFYCFFSLLRRCYKNTTAQGEKTYQQKAQKKAHLLLSWALVCSKKKGDGRGGAERGRPFGAKCP